MPVVENVLARLLAGVPVPTSEVDALAEPAREIARRVASATNGDGALAALDAALLDLVPDVAARQKFRDDVFAADPLAQDQLDGDGQNPLWNVPKLPEAACLSDALVAEAGKAGRWLTDYIDFANLASPKTPSEFHEALALVILSAAVARRVCLQVSTTPIFTNLYFLLLGASSLYAKSTGRQVAEATIEAADLRRFILPARLTPESMLTALTGRKPRDFEDWERPDKSDWELERQFAAQRLWMLEECSSLFDGFSRDYTAGLLPLLLDLYDCPERKTVFTQGRGRQTVRRAYLTLCGISTPDLLKPHLRNPANWGNGLWARFVIVTPTARTAWQFWPRAMQVPDKLTLPLKALALERLPMPQVDPSGQYEPSQPLSAHLDGGVWKLWEAYAKGLDDLLAGGTVGDRLFSNYGRLPTTAIKVAMLLSAVDWATDGITQSPMIGLQHWARAQLITEGWRTGLHRLIELPDRPSRGDELETKITKLLHNAPNGLTAREISQAVGLTGTREREELDRALSRMKGDGLAHDRDKRKPKRGPEVAVWKQANA